MSDGEGRKYHEMNVAPGLSFQIGGALGRQRVELFDVSGEQRGRLEFTVDCETRIDGHIGFQRLLNKLHYAMGGEYGLNFASYNGKVYRFLVCWVRDHTHALKGMKYFIGDVKSAMELFRDSQREDGMIYDNYIRRGKDLGYFTQLFKGIGYLKESDDLQYEFRRIPVEADVEYLYIEGVYQTWRATGDDAWMVSMLDSMMRAVDYVLNSPVRWSSKFGLIKRGYTIDTWDFQSRYDVPNSGHIMLIDPDRTEFGVMHGDNTGFAQSLRYLAEMLKQAAREEEAARYSELSVAIQERLNRLAWRGTHYKHHVPEHPEVNRDFGVDEDEQISLSNAYALNRGISHDMCKAILTSYRSIRENLPAGSPGEWYTIYPPFDNFNDNCSKKWEYMNGSVVPIVAGELAQGAFEHGSEAYALDILKRIDELSERTDGYLHASYLGAVEPAAKADFTMLNLVPCINGDFLSEHDVVHASELASSDPWEWRGPLSGEIRYGDIPFRVDGSVSLVPGSKPSIVIPADQACASINFLHTMSGKSPVGHIHLEYEDGTRHVQYVSEGSEIVRWFQSERGERFGRYRQSRLRIAWQGCSPACERIGVAVYSMANPYPDKVVRSIVLEHSGMSNEWHLYGITLSNVEEVLPKSPISYGIPDVWGSASVACALIEGLAGVKDLSGAFRQVRLSPRWSCADVTDIAVSARYPASSGYVSYRYRYRRSSREMELEVTSGGEGIELRCLLPEGCLGIADARVNGVEAPHTTERIEHSVYACLSLSGPAIYRVILRLLP
ncbi:hypothetical protein IDH44_02555 [Paenibacillus sp. IB182496]|uniref:Alpha-L-rhamnosidase six-hairpin glycosidase domain-containing protein n=1 Tax=Paenibacillus sabuli TaxID=2772509 RepID=A0A927BR78_9BACL|nr:hypothetical protein [Paenibacillus sabuli]MBD2844059.1 hypothetical protein [Paenibacillus sabuli]